MRKTKKWKRSGDEKCQELFQGVCVTSTCSFAKNGLFFICSQETKGNKKDKDVKRKRAKLQNVIKVWMLCDVFIDDGDVCLQRLMIIS